MIILCMPRTKARKRPLAKTYIREWRRYRRLSQEALAEKLEISHTMVGRIENGVSPYNQRFLEAAAEALGCTPADLLMRAPTEPESLWSVWTSLSPPEKRQALEVLRALKHAREEPDTGQPSKKRLAAK